MRSQFTPRPHSALLTALCLLLTAATTPPTPGAPLRIGAVLSLTGIAAEHGTAIRDGMELAKNQLGAAGTKVEIMYEDDASQSRQTTTAVDRLALSGIHYIVGPTWGILAAPSEPVFRRHRILSFQPANSAEFLSGPKEQFFFLLSPPSSSLPKLKEFLASHPNQRIAIINVASEWGELWKRLFREASAGSGAEIVLEELPQVNELDVALRTLTTKMRQKKVSLLLSTTWSQGTATQFAELERQQLPMIVLSPDLNEAVDGGLVRPESRFVEGYTVIPKENPSFAALFETSTGRKPKKYSDTGYDSVFVIKQAVDAAGDDPNAVKKLLLDSFDAQEMSGRIKFNAAHDVEGAGYEILQKVRKVAESEAKK